MSAGFAGRNNEQGSELMAYPRHYLSARTQFLQQADSVGLSVRSHALKARGPDREVLYIDATVVGEPSPLTLVVNSGVHGPELYAGSACQCALIAAPPLEGIQLVLVHAINPWGAAHVRRNNENNVDLCRNFTDPEQKSPRNDDYDELHERLAVCGAHTPAGRQAKLRLGEMARSWGEKRYNEALLGGQYKHRDGFAFGGFAPSESRQVLESWLPELCSGSEHVVLLDLHTGLGSPGKATPISMQSGPGLAMAQGWFGDELIAPVAHAEQVEAQFPCVHGHTTAGHERLFVQSVVSLIIEFGTHAHDRITDALLRDHWAEHEDIHPADKALIKDYLLESFAPADPQWMDEVLLAFADVMKKVVRGIKEMAD